MPLPPTDPRVLLPYFNDTPQGNDELRKRQSLQDDDDLGDWEEYADSEYDVTPALFTRVAGVLHPSDSSQAYVFCGHKYVMIKVVPGTMSDATARGSKFIALDWPSLIGIAFAGWIDAVLPIPNTKHMYFFSGENYALINADPGS